MSQNINKKPVKIFQGFTLIELLIAVVIFGIISIISVQGLYDIVSIRAKQQTIEDGSDTVRVIARQISKSVTEANSVNVIENSMLETKNPLECHTFQYDSSSGLIWHKIEYSTEDTVCVAPEPTIDNAIITDDLVINSFTLTPLGTHAKAIHLTIEGTYENSLGDHPVKYSTTITRRI